ncbi:MAG: phosphate acyltransferase [Sulfurovum sp. PC08-66]|nr:MAG: phosphate acyltransferase [Sulfurovum sp. PC08-66]KIM12363.1 MAG: phosphate acyltransferase [Sulfuricurvum sp. PC08-66]
MGGDFGPEPIIAGVVTALKERKGFSVVLVGKTEEISLLLPKEFKSRVEILDAQDVISMSDAATDALKRKESSIFKAVDLVKNKTCDAVVSAGHSGATMSLATLRIGRIAGVLRPPLATLMPTKKQTRVLVMDVGANVDCDAEHLYQFAIMGGAYAHNVLSLEAPRVGLLSNGEEDTKGNEVTKAAFKKLKSNPYFKGNCEGNDVFSGDFDVVVTDGFIGNILLKTSEGVASMMGSFIKTSAKKSPLSLAGALMMKKVFNSLKKETDYAEYGGAPLIGLKGCAIISHGKSNAKAIKNAIFQALTYVQSGVNDEIEKKISILQEK